MKIVVENVTDCKFSKLDKTRIDCMAKFSHLPEPVPFTAAPNDSEAHGKEIFEKANSGMFGNIAAFVEPPPIVLPKSALESRVEKLEQALANAGIAI